MLHTARQLPSWLIFDVRRSRNLYSCAPRPIHQSINRGERGERGGSEVFLPFSASSALSVVKWFGLLMKLAVPIAEPVTTANARTGPAILDGASPFNRASSFGKTGVRLSARG